MLDVLRILAIWKMRPCDNTKSNSSYCLYFIEKNIFTDLYATATFKKNLHPRKFRKTKPS